MNEVPKRSKKENQVTTVLVNNVNDVVAAPAPAQANPLEEQLKQFNLSSDLEKYKQLLDLKQKLSGMSTSLDSQLNHQQQQQQQQQQQRSADVFDVNDLKECLRLLGSNNSAYNDNDDDDDDGATLDARNNHFAATATTKAASEPEPFKLFDKALGELEAKLSLFEAEIGHTVRKHPNHLKPLTPTANNRCYTLAIVRIVSAMLDHLRNTSVELNHEKKRSNEAAKQLDIHRKLVDGLTNELLAIKEQNDKLVTMFVNQQAKLEAEMEQMRVSEKDSTYE